MGLFTSSRTSTEGVTLQKPEGKVTAALAAINALPLIKAAKALDNFTFGWNVAVAEGAIAETDAVKAAFKLIVDAMNNATPLTTVVPKDATKAEVKELNDRWNAAAMNDKSPLQQTAAKLSIIEAAK